MSYLRTYISRAVFGFLGLFLMATGCERASAPSHKPTETLNDAAKTEKAERAPVVKKELPVRTVVYKPGEERVVNLLTDVSHDYSFNLSHADRNQSSIYKGYNCLTSMRSIHAADLTKINALVLLLKTRLPYSAKDAPYVLDFVADGGGVYLSVNTQGDYMDSLNEFLKPFGLETGDYLSENPKDWGINAHAPSELVFQIDGAYDRLTAEGGTFSGNGTVGFEVHGDGKQLFKSETVSGSERAKVDVDISGVKELKLITNDGGNGKSADHSVWYDPRMIKGDTNERVLLANATSVKVGWANASQDKHYTGVPLGQQNDTKSAGLIKAAEHPAGIAGLEFTQLSRAPVKLSNPDEWKAIYETADGKPVILTKEYGKGVIVLDLASTYYKANGEDETGMAIMRRLIDFMASGKKVAAVRGGGGWQGSTGYHWDRIKTTKDGLRIHYNDYTEMFVENDIIAYKECVKYLEEITGLSAEMKAAQIKEKNDLLAKDFGSDTISVDISGVKELELITTEGGNDNGCDHSIWADGQFITADGAKTKLLVTDAAEVEVGYDKATQDAHEEGKISINGKAYDNGIYVHAPSKMVYKLEGKQDKFTAVIGCNDTHPGSVGFKVIGDGKVLWESKRVYRGGSPKGNPNDINHMPEGLLFRIRYLACMGAGFLLPQGAAVDLAEGLETDWQVHLGMFSHEMGHAWSFPFCEVVGEEASAFIFNNLVLHKHNNQNHVDSVTGRLMSYLKRDDIDTVDLSVDRSDFKYYMFIDLMIREYGEEVWKNYNLLKYALLSKKGAVWTPHTTAWLWSIAAGRDVFPNFQKAFGSNMQKSKAQLPEAAMKLGFDPEAIGKLYNVPLVKPTVKRAIFKTLKDFSDVRKFYDKESKEKGQPKVEG